MFMPATPAEERLEQLLQAPDFAPPAEFAAQAEVADAAVYEQAAADPQAWWAGQARQRLDWGTPFAEVLDDSNPPFYRWFADGTLNVSYNCLDRHVQAGHGDRVAFHWHGEEGEQRDLTYAGLLTDVQRLANGLKARGVKKGDVVGIYLPMIPEVVVAMLACARIGAPHTVVFGGFSPSSVRERLEVSSAKVLITADGARRKGKTAPVKTAVDGAVDGLATLETIIVVRSAGSPCPMRPGRDLWYHDLLAGADPRCPAEPMEAEHPLFLLYSSGSTAKPKGIVHTTDHAQVAARHRGGPQSRRRHHPSRPVRAGQATAGHRTGRQRTHRHAGDRKHTMTTSALPLQGHDQPRSTRPGMVQGRVALVTGGTRGIGAAICRELADQGAHIAAGFWHDHEAAAKFLASTAADYPDQRITVHEGNIGQADDCRRVLREATDQHGRVDILVNNAGITIDRTVAKMTDEDWQKVIAVNLSGAFFMAQAAVEHMIEHGTGRIINVSSVIGETGNIGQVNYAASKSGLFGLTKLLARETLFQLSRAERPVGDGIGLTVNAVTPGYVATDMMATIPDKVLDRIRAQIPVGRLGAPEEIARVVAFLAADASAYITGQIWAVNGGLDM